MKKWKKGGTSSANKKLLLGVLIILLFFITFLITMEREEERQIDEYGNIYSVDNDSKTNSAVKKSEGEGFYFKVKEFFDSSSSKGGVTESSKDSSKDSFITTYGNFTVQRVIDGDTILINDNGAEERVRFIGIDTPESVNPDETKNVPFGEVASNYTKERLSGKSVTLKFDQEHEDQYGRKLCYVYLEDGTFYNLELVRLGYAKVLTVEPNTTFEKEFEKAEREAKEEKIGLWK